MKVPYTIVFETKKPPEAIIRFAFSEKKTVDCFQDNLISTDASGGKTTERVLITKH